MVKLEKNEIVTVDLENLSSNTFIIDTVEENTVLVSHPLSKKVLFRVDKSKINTTIANLKDSSERAIDFANYNRKYLDYNSIQDLEALGLYFAYRRILTPRQKHVLACICGIIANVSFSNDINAAMRYIAQNVSMLDDYNLMWYNNFKNLISGKKFISTKKQKDAIFNIAGFILAESANPSILNK